MSRLFNSSEVSLSPVQPYAGRGGLAAGGDAPPERTGSEGKIYVDLLLKMIPGEIVTLYTFAIKLVPLVVLPAGAASAANSPAVAESNHLQMGIAWGLFFLALVLTPMALSLEEKKPQDSQLLRTWRWRLGLATGAFPFWAYATTGEQLHPLPFLPALALILAAIYAVVAGIVAKLVAPK